MTAVETTTANDLLFASFDLPPDFPAAGIANLFATLARLAHYCDLRAHGLSPEMSRAAQQYRGSVPASWIQAQRDARAQLLVHRTRYGSPWETVLTAAVSGTPYATAAAAGYGILRGLRELLDLKKQYDIHQVELRKITFEQDQLELNAAMKAVEVFNKNHPTIGSTQQTHTETAQIANELRRMPPVRELEIITEGDPRA